MTWPTAFYEEKNPKTTCCAIVADFSVNCNL